MYGFNMVDLLTIIALVLYVLMHVKEGFFALLERLAGFLGGGVIAFLLYSYPARMLLGKIAWPPGVLDAVCFLVIFFLADMAIRLLLETIFGLIPERYRMSAVSQMFAVLPAFIDGLIAVTLVLFFLAVTSVLPVAQKPINDSRIASFLVGRATGVESALDMVFGKAADETLGFLTVHPEEEDDFVKLPFSATNLTVDTESEIEMLKLVNNERAKEGIAPLVMDDTLQTAARKHSTDMWLRSYFAHIDPDGKSPFDRMEDVGAEFKVAGENLALAHSLPRAHEGLMNSPGHKRNIMDPEFKRVGIGVIDGGIYGKMFTQDFSD